MVDSAAAICRCISGNFTTGNAEGVIRIPINTAAVSRVVSCDFAAFNISASVIYVERTAVAGIVTTCDFTATDTVLDCENYTLIR
jgi:hypothetical protein